MMHNTATQGHKTETETETEAEATIHELPLDPPHKEDRILNALSTTALCTIQERQRPDEMTARSAPLPTTIRRAMKTDANATVMFTSAYKNEGAPKVAFEAARSAAMQTRGKILYFHISNRPVRFFREIEEKIPTALDDYTNIENSNALPFIVLEDSGLVCAYIRGPAERMGRDNLRALVDSLRTHFELTVIGGDGVLAGGASQAFSDLVDGVILVAEAERTRVPVIKKVKHLVEEGGGKVVGAILNRREFHVPGWIYRTFYGGSDEFGYCP